MSKTMEIVLTRTVKIGGVYRAPGEVMEVTKKQALEILAAGAGHEQPSLVRSPEKGGKKPKEEGGNAQGSTDGQGGGNPGGEGQGGGNNSGQNAV